MKKRWTAAPFESRIRIVLLGILLGSLLLQGVTALIFEKARQAMESELTRPLYETLDRMQLTRIETSIPYDAVVRTHRGLEHQGRFRLRDTLGQVVTAAWRQIPPAARARLLAGETARVRHGERGSYEIRLYRIVGAGPDAQVIVAAREYPEYARIENAARWDSGVRVFGITLLVAAVFLVSRELVRPFRRLKSVAIDARRSLHELQPTSREEWEDVIDTFTATIERLKANEAKLQARYVSSEEERERLDRLNLQIIDAIPSALFAISPTGGLVRKNPAATRLPGLGTPAAGEPVAAFFASQRVIVDALQGHGDRHGEFDVVHAGERFHFEFRLLDVPGGGQLLLLDDRTRLRRLEELLAQRARLAALGETAAGLAHELRNAMSAVVGYARLVTRVGDAATAEIAASIEREAETTGELLNRFLEVAKPAEIKPLPMDGDVLTGEILDRFEDRFARAGLSLSRALEAPGRVSLDPFWLRQALSNLLENALEIVPARGRVHVSTSRIAGEWKIMVEDNGPGIAPELREKVLAPFVSFRPGGTGLGLALVQKVMTAHGGRVEVGAARGGGACFGLVFPCVERGDAAVRVNRQRAQSSRGRV